MPLEKQNKRKKKKEERRQKNTQEKERERNDRLDSEEDEIKKFSRLLERYLCKRR